MFIERFLSEILGNRTTFNAGLIWCIFMCDTSLPGGTIPSSTRPRFVGGTAEQDEISTHSHHAVLCDHEQSGCEIRSRASVGGTGKLRLAFAKDTVNAEPGFWLFSKLEKSLKGLHF
ncbi:hypothetical protein TNCV_1499671 [Trichonephila clavipes]|nr:hypothetical protein TNCV_1499671 [Trichonephila clavipes]